MPKMLKRRFAERPHHQVSKYQMPDQVTVAPFHAFVRFNHGKLTYERFRVGKIRKKFKTEMFEV